MSSESAGRWVGRSVFRLVGPFPARVAAARLRGAANERCASWGEGRDLFAPVGHARDAGCPSVGRFLKKEVVRDAKGVINKRTDAARSQLWPLVPSPLLHYARPFLYPPFPLTPPFSSPTSPIPYFTSSSSLNFPSLSLPFSLPSHFSQSLITRLLRKKIQNILPMGAAMTRDRPTIRGGFVQCR